MKMIYTVKRFGKLTNILTHHRNNIHHFVQHLVQVLHLNQYFSHKLTSTLPPYKEYGSKMNTVQLIWGVNDWITPCVSLWT
jgi:hypothetical protein